MSIQFNVSLCPWPKYTKEECQPAPWLIFNFLRKLLSDTCPLYKDISQGNTLHWPLSSKLLCFYMSNKFNVCLFLWPKYTKEERQPIPKLLLIVLLGGFCQKHAMYTTRGAKLIILYQVILLLNVHSVQCVFVSMN